MYKKILLCFITAALTSSCGIDYDGTTKIIFEGHLTNATGQPLQGIELRTAVSNTYDQDDIGYAKTDANGYYRMIFPKAKHVNTELQVNIPQYTTLPQNAYSNFKIYNINLERLNNYTIDFGTQTLYERINSVNLTLSLNGTSGHNIVKINAIGLVDNNKLDYYLDELTVNPLDDDPDYQIQGDFLVAKNQTITIKYLLDDGSTHSVQIPIGEDDVNYNLDF